MKNKNPKFAFYYLLSLVALIFTSLALGLIVFSIIDRNVSDVLVFSSAFYNYSFLRFGIASLLISTPIFFVCLRAINRGLKKNDLTQDSPLRNWLTYFILAVSAVIILGSLVSVVYNFLSGRVTLKSILQFLTVIVIAALIFSYYLYDIKRNQIRKNDRIINVFFVSSLVLIVAVFSAAWFFVESPQMARQRRIDDRLMANINSVESYVNSYYDLKGYLPENLKEVMDEDEIYANPQNFFDPETKKEIEYHRLNDKGFELCANFRADSYQYLERKNKASYDQYTYIDRSKANKQGWNCFQGVLWIEEAKEIEPKLVD